MDMKVTFPGGMAVSTEYKGFSVRTDQPLQAGGDGTAPSPFDLFLCSIGACAGFFALRFCQERQIDSSDLKLDVAFDRNPESKRVAKIRIEVKLPAGFPEKYRQAIVRTIDQCTVKRHILEPPEFEVATV